MRLILLAKLVALAGLAGTGGAWLGTMVLIRRQDGAFPWQAPLLFTVPGALLIGLLYAWFRVRRARSRTLYAILLIAGPLMGAMMLLPLGDVWLTGTGAGFGFVTAILWVTLHLAVRDRFTGAANASYGATSNA